MFQFTSMCHALVQCLQQQQQRQQEKQLQQWRTTQQRLQQLPPLLLEHQQQTMPQYQQQQQRFLSRFFSKKAKQKTGGTKPKPKPLMRHMHRQMALRNVVTAVCCSAVVTISFYILHNKRRRHIIRQFYGTYDADASFQRMMDCGYLQSCPAGSDKEEEDDKKKK